MRRTYELMSDNSPTTTIPRLSIVTTAASGSESFSTSRKVTWAIISTSNVSTSVQEDQKGPFFWAADGSTIYDIRSAGITNDAAADYDENSLQVYLNGVQLTRDVEFEEILDGSEHYRFQFIDIAGTGLPALPDATDQLALTYRESTTTGTLSGNENLYISAVYPDVAEGFTVSYENFGVGETIQFQVVYR